MDIPIWQNLIIYLNCIYISFFFRSDTNYTKLFQRREIFRTYIAGQKLKLNSQRIGKLKQKSLRKMKFDFVQHSVRRKSTSWPMKNVSRRPPCFFYSILPKSCITPEVGKLRSQEQRKFHATDKNDTVVSPLSLPPK